MRLQVQIFGLENSKKVWSSVLKLMLMWKRKMKIDRNSSVERVVSGCPR
jgi:hypothetical protein